MFTIINKKTGLVLFAKFDSECIEGQVAIEAMCTLSNPDNLPIYWDFQNKIFYTKNEN